MSYITQRIHWHMEIRFSPLEKIAFWMAVKKQRRQLRSLDADRLLDIGVSYDDAQREANKPFWRF